MELLNGLYLLYLDGYTGEHWVTLFWAVTINSVPLLVAVLAYFNWQDRRRYSSRR